MAAQNFNRQPYSVAPAVPTAPAQSFFPSFSPTTQTNNMMSSGKVGDTVSSVQNAFNAGVGPSRARWQQEQDLEDEIKKNEIIKQRLALGLPLDASLLPKSSQDTVKAAQLYAQNKATAMSTKNFPTNYFQ